jgi:hypothetical protein
MYCQRKVLPTESIANGKYCQRKKKRRDNLVLDSGLGEHAGNGIER